MILVLGDIIAREGKLPEALALSQEHVTRSRLEAGCVAHAVHIDSENPRKLVFVEEWASQEALWAHFQVPASRAFGKALAQLAEAPPRMKIYDSKELSIPTKG